MEVKVGIQLPVSHLIIQIMTYNQADRDQVSKVKSASAIGKWQ